jgi:hypothetical protein
VARNLCPCCGRPAPLGTGGAALRAASLLEAIEILQEVLEALSQAAEEGADIDPSRLIQIIDMIEEGDRLEDLLVDHIHKRARPQTHPDLMALARTSTRWLEQGGQIALDGAQTMANWKQTSSS